MGKRLLQSAFMVLAAPLQTDRRHRRCCSARTQSGSVARHLHRHALGHARPDEVLNSGSAEVVGDAPRASSRCTRGLPAFVKALIGFGCFSPPRWHGLNRTKELRKFGGAARI
jgi:hypothetical protein